MISFAFFSFGTMKMVSPAEGRPFRPIISTGVAGPACEIGSPVKSYMARALPQMDPTTNTSPRTSRPCWMRIVDIGPRFLSSFDSRTTPRAAPFGFALRSRISACSNIISRRSSIPVCFFAETSTKMVSPPQSSGTRPSSESCSFTRWGFAFALSILFTATSMGICAARE